MGRYWAGGSVPAMSDEDLDGLMDANSAASIKAQQPPKKDVFWVLEENWEALQLFLSCVTQWRYAPMGGVTGLDYAAVLAVMEMHQIARKNRKQRLSQLQWIERGALSVMNERSK